METKDAVTAFAALAQESRVGVLRLLVQNGPDGLTPGVIGEALEMPAPTLSFHLKALAHAGLIAAEQHGRSITYRADFEAMQGLVDYLTENCCGGDASLCATECATECAPVPRAQVALPGRKRRT